MCVPHVCRDKEEGEWAGGEGGGEGGEGKERGKIGAKVLVILYIQKGTSSITVIVAPYSSTV